MYSTQHRFSLDLSSKKILCPSCEKKRFVRYRDNEEKDYLPDYVGRCDREESCGYHYTPKQFFNDNPNSLKRKEDDWRKPYIPKPRTLPKPKPPEINYIPPQMMQGTFKRYGENYFIRYVESMFEKEVTQQLIERFNIGTSKRWKGGTVFWQVDINGNIRQAKTMLYNPNTGKRVKEHEPPQIGYSKIFFEGKGILRKQGIKEPNLSQCFFGEHQLSKEPDKIIAIVESEKTAILMSAIMPKYLWLATGGKNGCRWKDIHVMKPLQGRKVILFPDLGCYTDWSTKADQLRKMGFNILVSNLLEKRATQSDKSGGFDLADYFVKRDENHPPQPKPIEAPKETFFSQLEPLPKIEVVNTEQIEPFIKEQPENWNEEISELETYFSSIELPTHPIKLNRCSTITNVTLFLESHFETLKAKDGKETFLPYLNRLKELKSIIEL